MIVEHSDVIPHDELPLEDRFIEDVAGCQSMCVGRQLWFCTKPAGHAGRHVAHNMNNAAVASWDESDTVAREGA
jgi:hypothetical protein